MSDYNPDMQPEHQEPFIPPQYLLVIAGVAFLVAVVSAFTQPEFGVVGYGAVALGILSLLAWAFMAPDEARAVLTGRTARYGGLGFLVTVVLIVAMIMVYIAVRNQDWRVDLTERDDFSLSEEAADAIETLGADPTIPEVRLIAFYGAQQAGGRDRDAVLLEDYATTSGGKVSYEFINPDRNPEIARQFGITRNGQIAVVPLDEAGEPIIAEAEIVDFFRQDDLTNAILRVSAQGDFRLHVMNVPGGITTTPGELGSMQELISPLQEQLDWAVEDVSFLDALRSESAVLLNDEAVDGDVMMIVGGNRPLSDQELEVLADYVAEGGDLVIFAETGLVPEGEPLASDSDLSEFLFENFGLRFRNDVVIDPVQAIQNPLLIYTTNLDPNHFITTAGLGPGAPVVFQFAQSIEIAEAPPEGVTVQPLILSSDTAYARSDLEAVAEGNLELDDNALEGPLVLGAVAENPETGASVSLYGSPSLVQDALAYAGLGQTQIANLQVVYNTLFWATNYNDFFQRTTIVSEQRAQDVPVLADAQTLRTINFITLIVLPFGVLALGILVWWNSRERERAPH